MIILLQFLYTTERIPAPRDVSGGVHITTRAHIASDMGPGKGSRIPRVMGPPGTISLAIWYRGLHKGGGHIATTPVPVLFVGAETPCLSSGVSY